MTLKSFRHRCLIGAILLLSQVAQAQRTTLPQSLYWTRLYLRRVIHPHWELHWEADNRRFFEPRGKQHQFISHLHLHRTFAAKWEAWAGLSYSAVSTQDPNLAPAPVAQELRFWQAISWQSSNKRLTFNHRLRWEERFFGLLDHRPERFVFRVRYALNLQYPLSRHLILKAGDEVMVQWGGGNRQAFDQNRLWSGFEWPYAQRRGSVELLYYWMWQQNAGGDVFFDRDVLRLTVVQRI